jgi:hypothetical protein
MAYSLEVCELLTKQIEKFVSLNRHQIAGHIANIEFWSNEVRHALILIDGYRERFAKMSSAQNQYVTQNKVIEYDLNEPYIRGRATPPVRLDKNAQTQGRQQLVGTWRRFVLRCFREGMLSEDDAQKVCEPIGVSLEPSDFRSRR